MKKFFFIIIFFVFALTQKSFSYSSDPKQFIQEIVDEAKKVLVQTNTKEYKTKKLSEMALKTVDIKGFGFYSLGKYRKNITEQKKIEYIENSLHNINQMIYYKTMLKGILFALTRLQINSR